MGACASKFQVLKAAAAPPEDVASRDLSAAEEIVGQDVPTTLGLVPENDQPKRQMLGHLFKQNEGDAGAAKNNIKQSLEVDLEDRAKVEQPQENENTRSVTDTAAKDIDSGLENKGLEEEKKALEVESVSQYVETEASPLKAPEENPVDTAAETDESLEEVENQGPEKPDEIRNKAVEKSGLNREQLESHRVEDSTLIEKGIEEKPEAELTLVVELETPEAEKLNKEKQQAEATKSNVPGMGKSDGQKPSAEEDRVRKQGDQAEAQVPEGERVAEDGHNLDSEAKEEKPEEKTPEPMEQEMAAEKPQTKVVAKPATEKKMEDGKLAATAEKGADSQQQQPEQASTQGESSSS
ncbi:uncharacterized protein LOC127242386 [Andrographis paniculata]|uniref:uncharacterized protein LOC127242386 n=1 Tax=Andrographis paniculata TaxID=175694 RepID=UPI0021E8690F|nr:uncharacterized protein LOC127242386 [Andrographis paniculata]